MAFDFVGLAIQKTANNQNAIHQFLANPTNANNAFHAVHAARMAFPQLSQEFVIMGHSQGGGMAWEAAQRQAKRPVKGYLGIVAI